MKTLEKLTVAFYTPTNAYKAKSKHICISNGDLMPIAMTGYANPTNEDEVKDMLSSIAQSIFMIVCIEKMKMFKVIGVNEKNNTIIKDIPFSEFKRISDLKDKLIKQSVENAFSEPANDKEKDTINQLIKIVEKNYNEMVSSNI